MVMLKQFIFKIYNYLFVKYFNLISYKIYNNYFNYNKYYNVLEFVPNINKKITDIKYQNDDKLINTINNYCINEETKKFIVSLSGGVDSMVLISIIKVLGYEVIGLHINYNNREESVEEENFLKEWCKYNNIPLYVKSIQHLKRGTCKRSLYEDVTKNIRLDFYREIMMRENVKNILLAHHKDDIIENIFANVCRGRYILDLAVIKEKSIINNININRPMIDYYKDIIYAFAELYQIPYFRDTTPDWSVRGKYRNKIYPLIQDTFGKNIKYNLLELNRQSDEWNGLIQEKIIKPFMDNITWLKEQDKTIIKFNIENYKNYPLTFWNIVFMNIFNSFGYSSPSRKAILIFMNSINKNNYVSNIPLSNNCKCCVKKQELEKYTDGVIVKIEFK